MYAVHASLTRVDANPPVLNEMAGLLDALWAHATVEDGIEHMHARAGPERVDILFFVTAPSEPRAEESALGLLLRTYNRSRFISEVFSMPDPLAEPE